MDLGCMRRHSPSLTHPIITRPSSYLQYRLQVSGEQVLTVSLAVQLSRLLVAPYSTVYHHSCGYCIDYFVLCVQYSSTTVRSTNYSVCGCWFKVEGVDVVLWASLPDFAFAVFFPVEARLSQIRTSSLHMVTHQLHYCMPDAIGDRVDTPSIKPRTLTPSLDTLSA